MAQVKFACRAYHGTTIDRVDSIMKGVFYPSQNEWEWLGWGFYLFQDAPYHAAKWAASKAKRRKSEAAIIGATVDLTNCFDLIDIDTWEYATEFIRNFGESAKGEGLVQDPITINDRGRITSSGYHYTDCRYMQLLTPAVRGRCWIVGLRARCVGRRGWSGGWPWRC